MTLIIFLWSFTVAFYMYPKFQPCSSSFIGAQSIEVKNKHVFRNTLYLKIFHYVFQKARHLEQKYLKRILRHFILGRLMTISKYFYQKLFCDKEFHNFIMIFLHRALTQKVHAESDFLSIYGYSQCMFLLYLYKLTSCNWWARLMKFGTHIDNPQKWLQKILSIIGHN